MGDKTGISWTDHSFNPWWGCARISPACVRCYAEAQAKRYGHEVWRRHGPRRMLSDANWAKPVKWNREAEAAGIPAKVFCASMADVFEDHPQVEEPRVRLWSVIGATPWLRWQILTKRPENVAAMVPWGTEWPPHVWLGVSVENQRYADERIPLLLASGAKVKFLSCEPLIGPVDLFGDPLSGCEDAGPAIAHNGFNYPVDYGTGIEYDCDHQPGISWCIIGGESGGVRRREMAPEWLSSLAGECLLADVPVWVKQDSGPRSGLQGRIPDSLWSLKDFPFEPSAVTS